MDFGESRTSAAVAALNGVAGGALACHVNGHMKTPHRDESPRIPNSEAQGRGAELRSVRWLAERCGLAAADILPELTSVLLTQDKRRPAVVAHVAWWAKHPAAGSYFEQAARSLPDVPDPALVALLQEMRYDGLLYLERADIVGHLFFQRHGAELHAFSVWFGESLRGGDMLSVALLDFLAYASDLPGIARARVGATNPVLRRLFAPVHPTLVDIGWRVRDGGWIDFPTAAAKLSPDR